MASDLLDLSVEITKAHLSQNQMSHQDIPDFIRSIHNTLVELRNAGSASANLADGPHARAAEASATDANSTTSADSDMAGATSKVAAIRDENIDDPAYEGLDPWLAKRIGPNLAKKLDPQNEIHPTVYEDRIICLEDGSEVKLLRAYVRKNFGLEFHEYLDKWNLPDNYPTAPPAYVENKRRLAKQSGLGVTRRAKRKKQQPRAVAADATA
ncbi:MAG TPA: MucR family transcriptional regulator [Sphingopyxis sp.]|nr:MucR family transcriptional regulator [Sphingopyxis sp.]HMP43528.1 MucR family transcriptional regulator [Sphingopyxis sp.]HMQ17608.1 MucR family transcriptional regulator [Sphingopyxis sp.]